MALRGDCTNVKYKFMEKYMTILFASTEQKQQDLRGKHQNVSEMGANFLRIKNLLKSQ